jgi:hypothetical protein
VQVYLPVSRALIEDFSSSLSFSALVPDRIVPFGKFRNQESDNSLYLRTQKLRCRYVCRVKMMPVDFSWKSLGGHCISSLGGVIFVGVCIR